MHNKPNIPCTHLLFDEAKEKLQERYSCLEVVRASEHVAVSPRCIGSPKDIKAGIKSVLDAKLNTFSSRHNGVPVAYGNICWLDSVGRIHADNPLIHFSVALDFIIFHPKIGSYVSGTVNKVSADHLGVLIHSIFNASILKPKDQASDLSRKNIKEGQDVIFEITGMHVYNSLLAIEGKLVDTSRKREMAEEIGNRSSLTSKVSATVGVRDFQKKTKGPNVEYLTDMNAINTSKASTLNTSVKELSELTKLKHLSDETPQVKKNLLNVSTSVKKRKGSSEINNEEIDFLKASSSTKKKKRHSCKGDYNDQTVASAFEDDSLTAVESEKKRRNKCLQKTVYVEGEELDSSAADLRRKKEKHKGKSLEKEESLLDSSAKVQEFGKKKRHKKESIGRVERASP